MTETEPELIQPMDHELTEEELEDLLRTYRLFFGPTGPARRHAPVEAHRASKHRKGRTPRLTGNQRRLRDKWTRVVRRVRMQQAMDATALRRAIGD